MKCRPITLSFIFEICYKIWRAFPGSRKIFFLSSKLCQPALGTTRSTVEYCILSQAMKQSDPEAKHSPPSSTEIKNGWSYTSTRLCLHTRSWDRQGRLLLYRHSVKCRWWFVYLCEYILRYSCYLEKLSIILTMDYCNGFTNMLNIVNCAFLNKHKTFWRLKLSPSSGGD
jgi:hypothetical protein